MSPRRLLAVLLLAVVSLAGCQGRADVRVVVQPDGSGSVQVTVRLDREAAAKVGDLASVIRLDDLRRASWAVVGPTSGPGGWVQVSLTHPFADVAQGNALLRSLTGRGGPLQGARITRHAGLGSTATTLQGVVDFRRGLDAFGDPALVKALGGRSVSQVAGLLNAGAAPSPGQVSFTLVSVLPGASGTVTARPADPPKAFSFRGTETHVLVLLLTGGAVVLAVAALVLFVLQRLPGRHRPPPRRRRRQYTSADAGWELVTRRTGQRR